LHIFSNIVQSARIRDNPSCCHFSALKYACAKPSASQNLVTGLYTSLSGNHASSF